MRKAELAWRRSLAGQTLADVVADAERSVPDAPRRARHWFHTARV